MRERLRHPVICLLLVLVTLAVYWPVRHFEFLNYDDGKYVNLNPHVQQGLTGDGLRWALTNRHDGHWHPLTWLSLMADREWHGMEAGAFHLTNLFLHTANTVLLFLVLAALTGATWPSAWVAALFALHPLHVESVAWITERKDVLSGLFWMLTLGAYLRYVRTRRGSWYGLTVVSFALGLMSKPMVVTLPVVLLLLDHWPLRRTTTERGRRLFLEKLPLVALAAASCWITLGAARHATIPLETIPADQRVTNAIVAYAAYLQQMLWPTGLACFYPHPGQWPGPRVLAAAATLAGLTLWAVFTRRRCPAALVGWGWYLATLVPVIGLVQAGAQSRADRYTYLPLIGIWISIAWGLTAWAGNRRPARRVLAAAGALTVAACIPVTARQVLVWQNSRTLFQHALAVTENNAFAHFGLGQALMQDGQVAPAIVQYEHARRLSPGAALLHDHLGRALLRAGRTTEAVDSLARAWQLDPANVEVCIVLGNTLLQQGRFVDAISPLEQARRLRPQLAGLHNNLGLVRQRLGQLTDAVQDFEQALRVEPDYADARVNLGITLRQLGQTTAAIAQFEQARQLAPADPGLLHELADALEEAGRSADARAARAEAHRLDPRAPRLP